MPARLDGFRENIDCPGKMVVPEVVDVGREWSLFRASLGTYPFDFMALPFPNLVKGLQLQLACGQTIEELATSSGHWTENLLPTAQDLAVSFIRDLGLELSFALVQGQSRGFPTGSIDTAARPAGESFPLPSLSSPTGIKRLTATRRSLSCIEEAPLEWEWPIFSGWMSPR